MSGFLCSMVGATFGVAAAAEVIRKKKSVIANGNAQIDTAQSKFGGSSLQTSSGSDALIVNAEGSDLTLAGDFTLEFWFRSSSPSSPSSQHLFSNTSGPITIQYDPGATNFIWYDTAARALSNSISSNIWYHLAVVRSGTQMKGYINGTNTANWTYASSINFNTLYFGNRNNLSNPHNGHIDEIRISNTARYTSNFTAPTEPFVNDDNTVLLIHANGTDASTFFEDDNGVRASRSLIAQGNAQVDTAQSKFGGSALLCDGTGDYVMSPAGTQWNFGTSSFTIEYFIRFNVAPTLYVPIALRTSGAINNGEWWCEITNAEKKMYWGFKNQAGTQYYVNLALAGTAFTTGVWYHIALVNNSGTAQLYIDGVATGTTTALSGSFGISTTDLWVGAGAGSYSLNGWMDEVRISNTARYTANFTPATEPFVNDSNTLLLMHMDGTDASTVFRDDNGLIPATYTSDAVAFDGTDDFYSVSGLTTTAADSKFLTMAFTWFHNSGGNSRNQHFMTCRLGTTSGENGWEVCIQSGRFRYSSFDNSGASTDMVYGDFSGPTENAWNQIVAYVDHNNFANCKYFLNGVDRTSSLLNGASVGAVNLANNNINWGSSNVSIRIGEQDSTAGYNSGFSDFLGRISQIYVHNASGAPSISDYWDHSTGRPKDLGTKGTATGLAQPLIYHYGGTSTFPTNNGTGFNSYTLTANGGVTTNAANTIYARARRQRGVQAIGNAQISTAQSKFGGSSALFDGTGDYIRCLPAALFPTDNFTIEFWVRFVTVNTDRILAAGYESSASTENWAFYVSGTSKLVYYLSSVGGAWDIASGVQFSATTLTTNTWYHAALVRNGTTFTPYFDGVAGTTTTSSAAIYPTTDGFFFGGISGTAVNCYIDEVRISNTARYTANFTPSTAPFQNDANTLLLLHMDGTNASTVFFDDNGRDTTPT